MNVEPVNLSLQQFSEVYTEKQLRPSLTRADDGQIYVL